MAANDTFQKKLIAGLLGIFLGGWGIHKFFLGYKQAGITMLVVWLAAALLAKLIFGFLGIICSLVSLVGLIEGILYLVKPDSEFEATYLQGKKEWF
jgi:TM2 domain-containing membrane protein YozV